MIDAAVHHVANLCEVDPSHPFGTNADHRRWLDNVLLGSAKLSIIAFNNLVESCQKFFVLVHRAWLKVNLFRPFDVCFILLRILFFFLLFFLLGLLLISKIELSDFSALLSHMGFNPEVMPAKI